MVMAGASNKAVTITASFRQAYYLSYPIPGYHHIFILVIPLVAFLRVKRNQNRNSCTDESRSRRSLIIQSRIKIQWKDTYYSIHHFTALCLHAQVNVNNELKSLVNSRSLFSKSERNENTVVTAQEKVNLSLTEQVLGCNSRWILCLCKVKVEIPLNGDNFRCSRLVHNISGAFSNLCMFDFWRLQANVQRSKMTCSMQNKCWLYKKHNWLPSGDYLLQYVYMQKAISRTVCSVF